MSKLKKSDDNSRKPDDYLTNSKLKEEELLEELNNAFYNSNLWLKQEGILEKFIKKKKQAHQQIKEMIHHQGIDNDWLPTPENINALPEPVRKYIHDLRTNVDPAGIVRENILIKDTCRALVIKLEEKPGVTEEWIDKWRNKFPCCTQIDYSHNLKLIKLMFKAAGIKVVKE